MFFVDDIILGATIAGTATSLFGAAGKSKAQKKLLEDELAAEELRRTQMRYENLRQQRAQIRGAQQQEAIALSNQNASGAGEGSSARGGSEGQIKGQFGVNMNSLFQNLQIGERLFDTQRDIAYDKADVSKNQDIMNLGQSIVSMAAPLGREVGTSRKGSQPNGSIGDFFDETNSMGAAG